MDSSQDLHERLWWSFSSLALLDIRDLAAYMQDGDTLVAAVVIAPQQNPIDVLVSRPDTTSETKSLHKVGFARIQGKNDDAPITVAVWQTQHDGVYVITSSVPGTDSRWQRIQRLIASGPSLVGVFLDHNDFLNIGRHLADLGEVEVSRITARHRTAGNTMSKGWSVQNTVSRPSVDEAVRPFIADGYAIRSLTIAVGNKMHVHVLRSGVASLYSGELRLFTTYVLSSLIVAAHRRVTLLNNRARQAHQPPKQPIRLSFEQPTFVTRDDTGRLIDALASEQHLTVAVLHRNPYLHVTLADLRDGSNFDVMVTDEHQVDLYPGFRSSLAALTQLAQSIAEEFDAATIAEAAPQPKLSLEELVG